MRMMQARRRRLELGLERRLPKLYEARYAAKGLGHVLWTLLGPLLLALIVVPVVALLAALVGSLGLKAPSIDLPSLEMPRFPTPNITAPDWLQAIGEAIGAALSVLASATKYIVAVVILILGVRRTRKMRRKRTAAEQLGRAELLRRLAVTLSSVEATARAQRTTTIGEAFDESRASPSSGASTARRQRRGRRAHA